MPETLPTAEQKETDVIKRQNFDTEGPLDIDLSITTGRVTIALVDQPGASVEVTHDPSAGNPWLQGVTGLFGWLSGQFDEPAVEDTPTAGVRQTQIDLTGTRLMIRAPKGRLRMVPLAVTVHAPAGSNLELRTGSADVTVTGPAGKVTVTTGSGEIALDRADGRAVINTGSGALRLGPMLDGLNARTGSGEIEVSSIGGPTRLITGSGDVWLGAVQADVLVRTGHGDLTVADAAGGQIELITGSGDIRIGVRAQKAAHIDLVSGSGQAHSELAVSDQPPAEEPGLRVRGRTGSGDAILTAAVG